MDEYLTPPAGWHYSVHPWFAMDDIAELPDLVQVGTVLLPEFFHLAVGTEGMWGEGWPEESDFALFLNFHAFEGRLLLSEARAAGPDLPVAYDRFRKVVSTRLWKPMAVSLMTRYLARFMEEGGRPDEEFPLAHGPRAVSAHESRPSAAMRWIEQLESHASEAYAVARDKPTTPVKRKRNRITNEFLKDVARVYSSADKIGLPPTREVANHFKAPHSTAAKWVATARKRALLPPPGVQLPSPPTVHELAEEAERDLNERRLELEWWINESHIQLEIEDTKDPEQRTALEEQLRKYQEELEQLGGELPGRLE